MQAIIEGRRWLESRNRFLREELDRTRDSHRREAIEAEISRVEAELAEHNRNRKRWWLFGGPLPPS